MQSVPITTKVVSSTPVHVEVYSIQHYVIILRFPPPIKLTATIYICSRNIVESGVKHHKPTNHNASYSLIEPVLQLCEKPQTDMKCMMMCELTDDNVQSVMIYHGQTEVAACSNENTCIVKDTAYTDSMISWDSHDNMTMIHFSIKSLNITTNEGKWRCSHGSNNYDEKDLKIYSMYYQAFQ